MSLEAIKIDLIQRLLKVEQASVLKKVESLLSEDEIVAYTVSGEPLTKDAYSQLVKESESAVEEGDYVSHEELLKTIKQW